MKFRDLRTIISEINFNSANFDSYKPLRQPLRDYAAYLRQKYPPKEDPGFDERNVPAEDLMQFKPLYEEYRTILKENTGEDLGELKSHQGG